MSLWTHVISSVYEISMSITRFKLYGALIAELILLTEKTRLIEVLRLLCSKQIMVNMMVTSSKADNASVTLNSHFKDCQRILKSVTQPYPVTMLELAEVLEMGPEGRYRWRSRWRIKHVRTSPQMLLERGNIPEFITYELGGVQTPNAKSEKFWATKIWGVRMEGWQKRSAAVIASTMNISWVVHQKITPGLQ